MRWLLVLALAAALVGCKKNEPPPPAAPPVADRDRAFWKWVGGHVEALKQVKTGQEPVTAQLSTELEKVEPGLVFELGVGREPFELIISADGERKRFPTVKRLVAAAGELPGTKVIAFRPRKDVEAFSMDVAGQKLSGSNLWFLAAPDPDPKHAGLVAVTISVEGMTDVNAEAMKNAAFLLLEASVGEFDLETKVGAIDVVTVTEQNGAPFKKLKELPATLDGWK